jgi:hypothetical protein
VNVVSHLEVLVKMKSIFISGESIALALSPCQTLFLVPKIASAFALFFAEALPVRPLTDMAMVELTLHQWQGKYDSCSAA